jgi:hypothetical protein
MGNGLGSKHGRKVFHGMLARVRRSAEKNLGRLLTAKEIRECEVEVRRTIETAQAKERMARA